MKYAVSTATSLHFTVAISSRRPALQLVFDPRALMRHRDWPGRPSSVSAAIGGTVAKHQCSGDGVDEAGR
jgi:hypothetical protein